MRLNELTRGFGIRVATITAALILSSMIVLGAAIYSLIDDVLEQDVEGRIETEMKRMIALGSSGDTKLLMEEMEARARDDVSRLFAYTLFDNRGQVLAGERWIRPSRLGWARQAAPTLTQGGIGGGHILVLTSRVTEDLSLSIGYDIQWIAYVEEELFGLLRWAFIGGLGLAVLTAYLTMRLVAQRIDLVVGSAHAIMDGNLKQRVPVTGANDDFDHLSQTLNEMLDRIQGLIANIEQVTNDIAHDLRTPLGRLRQGLEQARTHANTTDDYARAVDRAIVEADGLLSTFTALLRIAQVEAGGRRAQFREVDLSEIARNVADAYELDAEASGHHLVTHLVDGAQVTGDRDLLQQAFANLIENSLTHTPAGATITIGVSKTVGGGAVATFADDGPGVPDSERERIFQRFYRLEQSRTSPGTGLGLSLVAAVAKLHSANLQVSDNGPGLRISLAFPPGGVAPTGAALP